MRNQILIVLILLGHISSAQNAADEITHSFKNFRESGIREKVYVQTDKEYYVTGETMWAKVWCRDAALHHPLDISKVAYIDISDTSDKILASAKIAMDNGEGHGSILLNNNIPADNYRLRAYTNWMKNFDPAFFFMKTVTIINPDKIPKDSIAFKNSYNIDFYPEGGQIVESLPSKIAFKATDQNSRGYAFRGFLLSGSDTIARFKSTVAGLGSFMFTPSANAEYHVYIKPLHADGFRKELPSIEKSGYTFMLSSDGERVNINAYTNIPGTRNLHLIAHTREIIKVVQTSVVNDGKATFIFNKNDLGEGISHITLFDDEKKPVCERLFFKKPREILDLHINASKQIAARRTQVKLQMSSKNQPSKDGISAALSVFKIDSSESLKDHNIISYLYLSSDLKGSVENPGYYFSDKATDEESDALMLTHGWRRFNWDKVIANEKPYFYFIPEMAGPMVTGKIVNTTNGRPAAYITGYFSAPSSNTQFKSSISDANGNVLYEMANLYGGKKLIAQTMPADANYKIQIDDPFSQNFSSYTPLVFRISNTNVLRRKFMEQRIQNSFNSDTNIRLTFPRFADSLAFYSNISKKYNLDDYTRFNTIEEILKEYVPLVAVRRKDGKVEMPVINEANQTFFTVVPLNLLDGVPVFNFTEFLKFDPLKIKSLDIVARKYILGNTFYEGILDWKTYKPSIENYSFAPNVTVLDYEGLQMHREFYQPDYTKPDILKSRNPDFRTVLFWEPDIKMDSQAKQEIMFFTSDVKGKYIIAVEGISTGGMPGAAFTFFEVE